MRALLDWLFRNREWLFSGIAVYALSHIIPFLRKKLFAKRVNQLHLSPQVDTSPSSLQVAQSVPTDLLADKIEVTERAEKFSEIKLMTAGDYYDFKYADAKLRIKIKEIRKGNLHSLRDRIRNSEAGAKEVPVVVVSFPEGLGIVGALPYCGTSAERIEGDFLLQEVWDVFPLDYSIYAIHYWDLANSSSGYFTFVRIYVENININTNQAELNLLAIKGQV